MANQLFVRAVETIANGRRAHTVEVFSGATGQRITEQSAPDRTEAEYRAALAAELKGYTLALPTRHYEAAELHRARYSATA